jgi:acetyltransferase-like isoleucine patch superfamily enzyme
MKSAAIYGRIVSPVLSTALRRRGIEVADGVSFFGLPLIVRHADSKISLGRSTTIISAARYTALGVAQRTLVRTVLPGAAIRIGDDTGLSGAVIVAAKQVVVGDRCLVGAGAMIVDTDFHPVAARGAVRRHASLATAASDGVTIGDDVFVGARAIILKGARIGDGSVIGAGAVVTGQWPAGSIIGGNPARLLGDIDGRPAS